MLFARLRLLWVVDCIITLISRGRMGSQNGPGKRPCPFLLPLPPWREAGHLCACVPLPWPRCFGATKTNTGAAGKGEARHHHAHVCLHQPKEQCPMPEAPIFLLSSSIVCVGGLRATANQISFSKENGQSAPAGCISFVYIFYASYCKFAMAEAK